MNRWILPAAVAGAVAVATLGASLVPAAPLPEAAAASVQARVSLVCPVFSSVTASVRVAGATTGSGLRLAALTEPKPATQAGQVMVVDDATGPLRVSATLPDPFGASSFASATDGPARGISATGCVSPRTDHWFTGVDVGASAEADLSVVNLDASAASVDIEAYGKDGRVAAPRGIEVQGNSAQPVSLSSLPRGDDPVTIRVSSSDGRFAAFVRQRSWLGQTALGGDWLASGTGPATDQVVPGVAAGEGARRLIVTNPGERTSTVTVGTLGSSGAGTIAGAEGLEVPPQSTRTLDLAVGLAGQPVALRITATQPVTAAVSHDTGAAAARRDPAYTVAAPELAPDSLWPVAAGAKATAVLALANPGDTEASVSLGVGKDPAQLATQTVAVPATSQVQVPLPAGATTVLRIQTRATGLRGAVIVTRKLGRIDGLAVWPLTDQESGGEPAAVVYQPRLGS